MGYSSFVVGQVMPFLIQKSQHFNYLTKINVFLDQIAHISACDKAKIVHESSLKSSVSAFSGGLTSFQNSMISTPIKIQFSPCPPCNSFARIYRHLIICKFTPLLGHFVCIFVYFAIHDTKLHDTNGIHDRVSYTIDHPANSATRPSSQNISTNKEPNSQHT